MQAVLDHPASRPEQFLDVDSPNPAPLGQQRTPAIVASGEADGVGLSAFKAVAVTKQMHRKRPDLVPIFDRLVYEFYTASDPKSHRSGLKPSTTMPQSRLPATKMPP